MENNYDELLKNIKTMDLIGFEGSGLLSKTVSHFQKRLLRKSVKQKLDHTVSHVGLIIRGSDICHIPNFKDCIFESKIESDKVYMLESTLVPKYIDPVPDIFGKYPKGIRLRRFDEILEHFNGKIYHSALTMDLNDEHYEKVNEFIIDKYGTPYEKSYRILLSNVFKCLETDKQTDSMFCSELVAKLCIKLGIMPDNVDPEKVAPLDFYRNPKYPNISLDLDKQVPLVFNEAVRIK